MRSFVAGVRGRAARRSPGRNARRMITTAIAMTRTRRRRVTSALVSHYWTRLGVDDQERPARAVSRPSVAADRARVHAKLVASGDGGRRQSEGAGSVAQG